MDFQLYLIVLLFPVAFMQYHVHAEGVGSRCESPATYMGNTGSVTCYFSVDLKQSSKPFRLYRYSMDPTNISTRDELVVLECYWLTGGKMQCEPPAPGYVFNGTVSDQVRVTIPKMTPEFQGKYECRAEPSYPRDIKECVFLIKFNRWSTADQTGDAESEEDSSKTVGIAVAVVVAILLAATAIVLFVFRKRVQDRLSFSGRQKRNFRISGEETPNETGTPFLSSHAKEQSMAEGLPEGQSAITGEPEDERENRQNMTEIDPGNEDNLPAALSERAMEMKKVVEGLEMKSAVELKRTPLDKEREEPEKLKARQGQESKQLDLRQAEVENKSLAVEEQKAEVEKVRLAVEEEKAEAEKVRLAVEEEKAEVEKVRLAVEEQKAEVGKVRLAAERQQAQVEKEREAVEQERKALQDERTKAELDRKALEKERARIEEDKRKEGREAVGRQVPSVCAAGSYRILLMGKTGHGKSDTGNTILGEKKFLVSRGMSSGTEVCQLERGQCLGRTVEIMDTPGLCNTDFSEEEVVREIARSVSRESKGFHVVLYFVRCDMRYTQEEHDSYKRLKALLGENCTKHMIVVLTRTDTHDKSDYNELIKVVGKYISNYNSLVEMMKDCKERHVPFSNKADEKTKSAQLEYLFSTIDKLLAQNGDKIYRPTLNVKGAIKY